MTKSFGTLASCGAYPRASPGTGVPAPGRSVQVLPLSVETWTAALAGLQTTEAPSAETAMTPAAPGEDPTGVQLVPPSVE